MTFTVPSTNYTGARNVWVGWFLAGNQNNHQNFDPSLALTDFHGDEAKKNSKLPTQKKNFSKLPNLKFF